MQSKQLTVTAKVPQNGTALEFLSPTRAQVLVAVDTTTALRQRTQREGLLPDPRGALQGRVVVAGLGSGAGRMTRARLALVALLAVLVVAAARADLDAATRNPTRPRSTRHGCQRHLPRGHRCPTVTRSERR